MSPSSCKNIFSCREGLQVPTFAGTYQNTPPGAYGIRSQKDGIRPARIHPRKCSSRRWPVLRCLPRRLFRRQTVVFADFWAPHCAKMLIPGTLGVSFCVWESQTTCTEMAYARQRTNLAVSFRCVNTVIHERGGGLQTSFQPRCRHLCAFFCSGQQSEYFDPFRKEV